MQAIVRSKLSGLKYYGLRMPDHARTTLQALGPTESYMVSPVLLPIVPKSPGGDVAKDSK